MIEHELPSRDEIVAMLENAGLQLSAYCRFESDQTGAGLDHNAAHGFRASTLRDHDRKLVPGKIDLGARQAEYLDRDAELEGTQAVVDRDKSRGWH
jgi:hypothetical protein